MSARAATRQRPAKSAGTTPRRARGSDSRARPVRQRRAQSEVREAIVAAARSVFAEHGFGAATTREIATRARASEVLIFRYFGSKAGLFETIVIEPFNELLTSFIATNVDWGAQTDRRRNSEQFVSSFFEFLSTNADLLQALAKSAPNGAADHMHGLDAYFRRSSARLRRVYAEEGAVPDVDPDLTVRFGFGMLAAAVLFRDWFFPDGAPDSELQKQALSRMIFKANSPRG
jgi:AcrR family transcriptional regulator